MAATALITIQGTITGLAGGESKIGPITLSSAAANGQKLPFVLVSGANTVPVPPLPKPSGCIITLDPANTVVTTLKGVAGDTGIAIGKTTKIVLNWDPTAPPSGFVLDSAGLQTGVTYVEFF